MNYLEFAGLALNWGEVRLPINQRSGNNVAQPDFGKSGASRVKLADSTRGIIGVLAHLL